MLHLPGLRGDCYVWVLSNLLPIQTTFFFATGCLLTRSAIVDLLRHVACQVGLPYISLKGHSFWYWRCLSAAAAGLPDLLLKVLGGWSSDCYQLYIRTPGTMLLSKHQEWPVCHISNLFSGFEGYTLRMYQWWFKSHGHFLKLWF